MIVPYGAWPSPVSAAQIGAETISLSAPRADGETLYWLEGRPNEGGRQVLVRLGPDGRATDFTAAGHNVRTRVHEYGGGAYALAGGRAVYSNHGDGRLYLQAGGAAPVALTPAGPYGFADLQLDLPRNRVLAVREDRRGENEPEDTLVAVRLDAAGDDPGRVLARGHDFYGSPRLSPDGSRLAWLTWDHPDMPWDASRLWLARLRPDGDPEGPRPVAGGAGESIFQPLWGADGSLHYVSDRTGWWNPYRWRGGEPEALWPLAAEFGLPQWVFGQSTCALTRDGGLVAAHTRDGLWRLGYIPPAGPPRTIATPYTEMGDIQAWRDGIVCLASAPDAEPALVYLEPHSGVARVLRRGSRRAPDPDYLSTPEPICFPGADGHTAHALFYPPRNRDVQAPAGTLPPLLVRAHGGPTAAAGSGLDPRLQYWTSRGFAVLDVNYGGSTGYGRAYRESLHGAWGVVDVADCARGARHLADLGRVDPHRLAIRGSSAGGYTTLACLAFTDTFQAGASYYGISDLEALARDTHKFESRYLERLVGPYPARRDRYRDRSPLHHTDRFSAPVIFFQGLDDRVVPPDQSERMARALAARGLPCRYLAFPGEQHGFRQAASIRRALEEELAFYGRVFGFRPADGLAPGTPGADGGAG